MRLRHAALTIGFTAATLAPAGLPSLATPAYAAPAQTPRQTSAQTPARAPASGCGKAADRAFPIKTRIHGGPASYEAGGDAGTWYLDLTNTTHAACRDIHPVVVLTDRERALTTSQVRLELTDPKGHWRSLSLEKSDEDETIGVLDADTAGFAVPAGRTVTVRARFVFTGAARPNKIAVSAATVQRQGDDGDWVGESNAYHFAVVEEGDAEAEDSTAPGDTDTNTNTNTDADADADTGTDTRRSTDETGSTGDSHSAATRPGAHEPGGHESAGHEPSGHEPAGHEPSGHEPAGHEPAGHEPSGHEPSGHEPTSHQPGGHQLAGHESAGHEPADRSPRDTTSHAPSLPELASTGLGSLLGRTAAVAALVVAGVALFVGIRRLRTVRR